MNNGDPKSISVLCKSKCKLLTIKIKKVSLPSPTVEAANHMAERVQQRELEAHQVKTTGGKGVKAQVDTVS